MKQRRFQFCFLIRILQEKKIFFPECQGVSVPELLILSFIAKHFCQLDWLFSSIGFTDHLESQSVLIYTLLATKTSHIGMDSPPKFKQRKDNLKREKKKRKDTYQALYNNG